MLEPAASRARVDPRLAVLPVLCGHCDDFPAPVARTRDFVQHRESVVGPWLFDASVAGCDLWSWVAARGYGDSCRDSCILDEFVEVVFAFDPLSRMVGVAARLAEDPECDGPHLPASTHHHFTADWLDLLVRDPAEAADRYSAPRDEPALDERIERILELSDEDVPVPPVFRMTIEALWSRVIVRTNRLRELYGHFNESWPQMPGLRITYPTDHVVFCMATPELAESLAAVGCSYCEGCDHKRDLLGDGQLKLPLGGCD